MFKHLKFLAALAAIITLFLLALPAQAEVGVINLGATNTIAENATTAANLGVAVKVDRVTDVAVVASFQGSAAGASAVTYTWARSIDGVNYETTPRPTTVWAQNGTTAVIGYTNLPSAWVGAAAYIKLVGIASGGATGNLTNHSVKIAIKK